MRSLWALAALAAASAGGQSLRVIHEVPIGLVSVQTNSFATIPVPIGGVAGTADGVGLRGLYVTQQGDTEDGLGPWSLDVRVTAVAPDGSQVAWNPIGGDVTIADYPLSDGMGGFAGVPASGGWVFTFDSVEPVSNWRYGIEGAVIYLLARTASAMWVDTVVPDVALSWDRPFFIEGVSGLGPVAYAAFEFEVSESGVYEFDSVLSSGGDHYTFLYEGDALGGGFDPQQPLSNLLDYGLGNGNSPFGVPRGTSRISALLLADRRYTWVTSQWSEFSQIAPSTNTIVGPGVVNEVTDACPADVNGDGTLNDSDFFAWVTVFTASPRTPEQEAACDVNEDGSCTDSDFFAWVTLFTGEGCP
ncbi:MAG: GC-type dockerin domain-anchored protein [Planctomycetota bacterium]